MVKIYTEDTKEGLLLMRTAASLYLHAPADIDSFKSINALKSFIGKLEVSNDDKIFIIYDSAAGSKNIDDKIVNVVREIDKLEISDRVRLLPIVCSEYEVLAAPNIAQFAAKRAIPYIKQLCSFNPDNMLTRVTKADPLFSEYYAVARQVMRAQTIKNGKQFSDEQIDRMVSVEKLCKRIFKDAFNNDTKITDDFGRCWVEDCCVKAKRSCNIESTTYYTEEEKQQILLAKYKVDVIDKINSFLNEHSGNSSPSLHKITSF